MVDEKSNDDMQNIIVNLRKKMAEIDEMTQKLSEKRKELDKESPKKTKRLLEEIKVPALEVLK